MKLDLLYSAQEGMDDSLCKPTGFDVGFKIWFMTTQMSEQDISALRMGPTLKIETILEF